MMPYALQNPTDSASPSWRYITQASDALSGEVVIQSRPKPDEVWDAAASSLKTRTSTQALSYAKTVKEAELRDNADEWYGREIRSFEGSIVAAKYGRGGLTALNAEERIVFDEMNANYVRLKDLTGQVRAATTVSEVEGIAWTP